MSTRLLPSCQVMDLTTEKRSSDSGAKFLSNIKPDSNPGRSRRGPGAVVNRFVDSLDDDGLPLPGTLVQYGDPMFCVVDSVRYGGVTVG